MRKVLIATFYIIAGFSTFINSAYSQQNIIADKDNTHPQQSEQQYVPARVYLLSAVQMNGYNEVRWSSTAEQDTKKYIVEYSSDGINYRVAGEVTHLTGSYLLKHQTLDPRTFLYRIRIEKKDGRFFNSVSTLMSGAEVPAVIVYPTVIEGNTLNLRMDIPVQRVAVLTTDGRELFSKQMGGLIGSTQIIVPSLSKGIYYTVFYGNGWQATERFVVAR